MNPVKKFLFNRCRKISTKKITIIKKENGIKKPMKYNEFDLFIVDQIKGMIGHNLEKAMDLFADSYVATYRIAHDIKELQNIITKQHDELCQALDLCVKCLKLVETTVKNRKQNK